MEQYSHLEFYNNSERGRNVSLGGSNVIGIQGYEGFRAEVKMKTTTEKHADILEYLKRLPPGARVSLIK